MPNSVKNAKFFSIILILAGGLSVWSWRVMERSPLTVFVLRGQDNNFEAFKVDLFLNRQDDATHSIPLDSVQEKRAAGILAAKDTKALESFSMEFGKFSFAVGLPTLEEGWPSYLGGGIKFFFQTDPLGTFDNLQFTDRLYLAWTSNVPPPPPVMTNEASPVPAAKTPIVSAPETLPPATPPLSLSHPGAVRVEILNGCGITNAAEWIARRLKGPGIIIVDTDNADNFHYSKTLVRSAAGLPVALEEALDRLGIPKESVEEIPNPPGGIDVVVIVGKDFRKLKGRARERAHH